MLITLLVISGLALIFWMASKLPKAHEPVLVPNETRRQLFR